MLAVGVPVPGLPWTVVQEIDAVTALAPLHTFRLTAAAIAALVALALALAFAAFWWRQTGRHHRELAVQYRDLAARIHTQRRLLEGITGTINFEPNGDRILVDGGEGISTGQPRFAPDGRTLAYLCDRTGWHPQYPKLTPDWFDGVA